MLILISFDQNLYVDKMKNSQKKKNWTLLKCKKNVWIISIRRTIEWFEDNE